MPFLNSSCCSGRLLNGVKYCAQIQKCEKKQLTAIRAAQQVIHYLQEGSLSTDVCMICLVHSHYTYMAIDGIEV